MFGIWLAFFSVSLFLFPSFLLCPSLLLSSLLSSPSPSLSSFLPCHLSSLLSSSFPHPIHSWRPPSPNLGYPTHAPTNRSPHPCLHCRGRNQPSPVVLNTIWLDRHLLPRQCRNTKSMNPRGHSVAPFLSITAPPSRFSDSHVMWHYNTMYMHTQTNLIICLSNKTLTESPFQYSLLFTALLNGHHLFISSFLCLFVSLYLGKAYIYSTFASPMLYHFCILISTGILNQRWCSVNVLYTDPLKMLPFFFM